MLDELDDINKLIRKEEKSIAKHSESISTICPLRPGLKIANVCYTSIDDISETILNKIAGKIENGNSVGQRYKNGATVAERRRPITDFNSGSKKYQDRIRESQKVVDDTFNNMPTGNSVDDALKNGYNTNVKQKVEAFLADPGGGIEYDVNGLPNFDEYNVCDVTLPTSGPNSKFVGGRQGDFITANEQAIGAFYDKTQGKWTGDLAGLVPDNISTKEAFEEWRLKFGLTWHHHQDLKTLKLVPREIHKRVGHLGGESIQKQLNVVQGNSGIYNVLLQQYKTKFGIM